jgi:hypothetical protein
MVAVASLLAFRWYRGERKREKRSIHGQHHDLEGCHIPLHIDLWPQDEVPLTLTKYDNNGGPFLTAYVPPGKAPLSSLDIAIVLSGNERCLV